MTNDKKGLLLGLDVGTQGLRAALVDRSGRTVACGVSPIETTYPRPTWAEQDVESWWSAARAAVRSAMETAGAGPDEVAIERVVEPDSANAGVYDELFGRYVDLYARLNARGPGPGS